MNRIPARSRLVFRVRSIDSIAHRGLDMASLREPSFRSFYRPGHRPLEDFYIPALKASIAYDRSAGFFSSSALAAAASGVAHLIQSGGWMRLLVGAQLYEDDVDAIRKGEDLKDIVRQSMLDVFPDPEDALEKQRLEVLAWMVAEGTLEIKVVLPLDSDGLPIAGSQAQEYYHTKKGIFTDEGGDRVAFVGSVNESAQAWKHNFEEFSVYLSWESERERNALEQVALSFDELWDDCCEGWKAIEIPQAIRERLIAFRPSTKPKRDPLEKEREAQELRERQRKVGVATPQERVIFQFLRDAPKLWASEDLGVATSAVTPWPHQLRIGRDVLRRYPEGSLLCDEVGLGKTIEAGIVIRSLIISGRVKRLLILTPKSVLKQWQEELHEKFGLDIPRFDAGKVLDVRGNVIEDTQQPWATYDRLLASSQLAKRRERAAELEAAAPWDLLVIDEAHHARRRDFRDPRYRPNRLLSLLEGLRDRVGGILLVTATPMQVHPVELWDLLVQLGVGGAWAADEDHFLRYFKELRKPFRNIDWDFVLDLVQDELKMEQEIDPDFLSEVQRKLGAAIAREVIEMPSRAKPRSIRSLPKDAQPYLIELARRHTPLRPYLFRSTRDLLRRYQEAGILNENVPHRKPEIERVRFNQQELALYHKVDDYITNFYHKYENERRGLGFVMTVYRRRLTSSFYALRLSLERRIAYLRGEIGIDGTLTEDDLEQESLRSDIEEVALANGDRSRFAEELAYLEEFIYDVRALGESETKLESLKAKLHEIFHSRDKAIIFSQYTDTMDFIREQLKEVYGTQVACYSGRGGEIWNGIAWVPATKEYVKTRFSDGDVRILVCTEAASEGLNLQTCGVLINYDMPWNPMRVEQRIGRIDRIGQRYEEIWITNYYYEDTIEDKVYDRLKDRLAWFEVVVGALQPILAEVGEATRRLAMVPEHEREKALDEELREIEKRIETLKVEGLDLDQYVESGMEALLLESPVDLKGLEQWLCQSQATGGCFDKSAAIEGAYTLMREGQNLAVTFDPDVFDRHPDSVRFMTYGNPLMDEMLNNVDSPEEVDFGNVIRFQDQRDGWVGWYQVSENLVSAITSLSMLEAALKEGGVISEHARDRAHCDFQRSIRERAGQEETILGIRRKRREGLIHASGKSLLERAVLVEIALGRQKEMFESETYPTEFSSRTVLGLQRHGYPWTALLKLCPPKDYAIRDDDAFASSLESKSSEDLKGIFRHLTSQARDLLEMYRSMNNAKNEGKGSLLEDEN